MTDTQDVPRNTSRNEWRDGGSPPPPEPRGGRAADWSLIDMLPQHKEYRRNRYFRARRRGLQKEKV